MNIDIESIGLLSLLLQDSPKDRQLILCILARSNTVPTRITFSPNTEYPTFYGYTNSRIPFYLMGKGVISNVPREGFAKRLLSSHYLSYAETIINRAGKWDIHQKLMSVSKFIKLDNNTTYKDAEVFLIFRDKALGYIKDYASSHKEEISSFLGAELSGEIFKTVTNSEAKKPEDNYKAEIEAWLASKDDWTIRKIWQVVSALNSEWQLRDQDIFKIPIEKFVKDWVDNEGELEAILTNLHNRKIIEVSRKLGETPPSNDPNKPEGSIWTTIDDQPEIIRREDTQIEIFPKKFGYLVKKLAGLVKEKSPNIQGEDLKKRYDQLIDEIKSQGMSSSSNLEERYLQILGEIKSQKPSPPSSTQTTAINLIDKEIKYDDKKARMLIGNMVCQLPPYKNEHYLCGVMFKKKANQPVDWSVVYEKMSGDYETHYGKPPKTREHWRTVYDTMIRINDRIKKEVNTSDDLFSWQELTIKRNF